MGKRDSYDDDDRRSGKRRKSNDGRFAAIESGDGCSVFVGNLKYETKWQALKDHMRRAGNVDSAKILEAHNGRSKGCALVRYQHPREAQRAIQELNESELEGRTIFVQPDNGNPRNNNNNDERNDNNNNNNDGPYGVLVENLPDGCSLPALEDLFKSCGIIEGVRIPQNRKKGFGIVEFSTERAVVTAIRRFHGVDFQGKTLRVTKNIGKKPNGESSSKHGGRPDVAGGRTKVFIGNLDYDCSWQSLKDMVARSCGGVEHVEIPKRGWGVATFASTKAASKAISRLDNTIFRDRTLEVRWDRDNNNNSGGGDRDDRRNDRRRDSSSLKQLYVGNLPYDCTWQELKDAFKQFGAVTHAEVCETSNGRTTGFGIVAFSSAPSAERALNAMDGTEFKGRTLTVRWDRNPEKLEAEKSAKRDQKPRAKPPKKDTSGDSDMAEEPRGDPLDMALSASR